MPKIIQKEIQHYTSEEIEMYRHAFTSSPADIRQRAFFELLLHSGLRRNEALSLNRNDINLTTEEGRVLRKGGIETTFSFDGAASYLYTYLQTRTDNIDALFVSRGKRLSTNTAKSYLRHFKKKVHIDKPIGYHMTRKTYATILLESGLFNIKEVQIKANHASERTTMKYYVAVEKSKLKPKHREVMSKI